MRTITFTNANGVQILCDPASPRSARIWCAAYLPPVAEQIIQPAARPRQAYIELIARGNVQNTIRFSADRKFADYATMHLFQHSHPQKLAGLGTFATSLTVGGYSALMTGLNWIVRITGWRESGLSALIDYEAIGGLLTGDK